MVGVNEVLPGDARIREAAERVLTGERRGLRAVLPFLGPAFIAAVAYIDPGNFATNMASGSRFGYTLLWVVLSANLIAMLVQALSAKLLWVQAEVIAMATDLAEFIGAALGLYLVFHLPLLVAGLLTGVMAFAILGLQAWGFRRLEAAIAGLVGVVVVAFGLEVLQAGPSLSGVAGGTFVPQFSGGESVFLAVGIVGATVMPHVIYLHSALMQRRIVGATSEARRRIFRFELVDVVLAMGVAGLINMAMLATAAAVFHSRGLLDAGSDLTRVFSGLDAYLGDHSGLIFGLALLASGISSSSVGTLSGQVVMQGFIHRRIPIFLRRAITMLPALVVIAIGFDPSRALVLSQAFLSFGIPFALVPLVVFTSNRRLMGSLVNSRVTTAAAAAIATVIVTLNVYLLLQTFGVALPIAL
ncbi:MAG: divalent metal cation transporter [Chloroflexi bacterium]|nr:MAG: divalent metal cation transporter [Chloroflexota bacterium]